ncbi:LTBP3 protein, partial [Polypterus senegalus]
MALPPHWGVSVGGCRNTPGAHPGAYKRGRLPSYDGWSREEYRQGLEGEGKRWPEEGRHLVCPLPCMNGGQCTSRSHCLCPPEFTGRYCQHPLGRQSQSSRSQTQSTGEQTAIQPQTSMMNIRIMHYPESSIRHIEDLEAGKGKNQKLHLQTHKPHPSGQPHLPPQTQKPRGRCFQETVPKQANQLSAASSRAAVRQMGTGAILIPTTFAVTYPTSLYLKSFLRQIEDLIASLSEKLNSYNAKKMPTKAEKKRAARVEKRRAAQEAASASTSKQMNAKYTERVGKL